MPDLKVIPQQLELPGLPKPKEEGHKNFAEIMEDPKVSLERKLHLIGITCEFITLNGLTKADLHAMLKVSYAVPDQTITGKNEYICGRCKCAIDARDNYCRMCGGKIGGRE